MRLHPRFSAALLLLAVIGCSSSVTTTAPPDATTTASTKVERTQTPDYPAYAAVVEDAADVFPAADGTGIPLMNLANRNENGAPQTLLIQGEQRVGSPPMVWYHVLLPVRPNGSTGWIRASDVNLVGLRYRLEVHLETFRLDLFDGDNLERSITIGTGTDQTPTPGGTYYIKELLRPPDQNTIYGHYVFGLSGFSNVLVDWPGGGVLGIHGTNDADRSLGAKASHGCIRMSNADIEFLATLLPLGTPVMVFAS